ncbi:hypothetical protein PCYB_005830, partial [Plasmodium cynomolgi strain B]
MDMQSNDLQNYHTICSNITLKKLDKVPNKKANGAVILMTLICKRILRYIHNHSLLHIPNSEYDGCILLNYWVYSILDRTFGSKNPNNVLPVFAILAQIWNYIVDKYRGNPQYIICEPDQNTIARRDWKQRKELYDNYGKCISDEYACPDVLKKYEEKKIVSEIKQLPCYSTIKGTSGSTSGDDLSHETAGRIEMLPASAVDLEDIASYIADVSDTQLDSGNSGIGTKVTHSIFGAAPVLLTGTMLYR